MILTRKVFEKAGIEVEFKEIPPKRILHELTKPQPACSPGWFKTPEREKLYLFSAAIYQDAPLTFVARKSEDNGRTRIRRAMEVINGKLRLLIGSKAVT